MNQEWHLFISPHFDDAAFSCGGTILKKTKSGHNTALCTVFSRDARPMGKFALECQESKGIPHTVSYLELRSVEDSEYAEKCGVKVRFELGFLEAPYRGYDSIVSLFSTIQEFDHHLVEQISFEIIKVISSFGSRCVLYIPSAIGGHVDHLLVRSTVETLLQAIPERVLSVLLYEDFPYCARHRPKNGTAAEYLHVEDITNNLDEKIENLLLYRSQIKNQFGSDNDAKRLVLRYAEEVAAGRQGMSYAERFSQYRSLPLSL